MVNVCLTTLMLLYLTRTALVTHGAVPLFFSNKSEIQLRSPHDYIDHPLERSVLSCLVLATLRRSRLNFSQVDAYPG